MMFLEEWIVTAVRLDIIALHSHFLAKHLETVIAGFVHFTWFALGTEVSIARCKFVDDTIQSKIAIARHSLALHS